MSIAVRENEFDGDCNEGEQNFQWSPFKEYKCHTLGLNLDYDAVKSLIEGAFPDQEQEQEIECKKLTLKETVQDLTSFLYHNRPCASQNESHSCSSSHTIASECTRSDLLERQIVFTWETLLHSFFQKKLIKLRDVKWRRQFLDVLSLHTVEKEGKSFFTSKSCSALDGLRDQDKDPEIHNKPDPIYSSFGKLRNGFYVSSKGLVFTSETELQKFNAKMAEMDEKLKRELSMIQHQHSKLKAKAEERKLLSQRTESHEESDHDDEQRENHQLNKESKPKEKAERKSGLFASLTASLSAARSGIQGFLEKSSPKERRHSPKAVPPDDNEDSEDETGKLTHSPNSQVPAVDGIDNHDEFTRQMQAKGGLMYESADRTVQQLSHDALPPPLSLQTLQAGSQAKE